MRRVHGSLVLAALLTLVTAQVALGARPVHEKFKLDETFDEVVCGIPVTTHLVINGNGLAFADRFVDLSQVKVTFTNGDGDWIVNHVSGRAVFQESLEGDILTIEEWHMGVHERLRTSDGLSAAFDRGRVVFRTVIDLNDLEDEEDDEVLSFEVISVAGPHPELDSDFALFCEIVVDVLG